MRGNPFWLPFHKRVSGRLEFDVSLDAAREEAMRCTEGFARLQILDRAIGLHIPEKDPVLTLNKRGKFEINNQITYQISFRDRPMNEETWAESGPLR